MFIDTHSSQYPVLKGMRYPICSDTGVWPAPHVSANYPGATSRRYRIRQPLRTIVGLDFLLSLCPSPR